MQFAKLFTTFIKIFMLEIHPKTDLISFNLPNSSNTNTLLKFTKMHGLGNDFIMIDLYSNINQASSQSIKEHLQNTHWLQSICHRQLGIGADQILVIEPSTKADFKYRIFNADGSEVEHCGNGARCFGRYVYDAGLTQKTCISVEVKRGLSYIYIEGDFVKVAMSVPDIAPASLPFAINPQTIEHAYTQTKQYQLSEVFNCPEFGIISMGNPHAIINLAHFNDNNLNLDEADLATIAKVLQGHSNFSQSVNVGLMHCMDKHTINLRVYERGSGETMACGTGACAAVAHGMLMGYLEFGKVKVNTKGGALWIEWLNHQATLYLTGPTSYVFEGLLNIA